VEPSQPPEPFSVRGRTVVITGGLGQLGRQFTRTLLAAGAKVAVFDLRADRELVSSRLGAAADDPNLLCLEVDVTERASVEAALASTSELLGIPFGLVNNAALDSPPNAPAEENGPFESYPGSSLDRILAANVKGPFVCSQVVGGAMASAGRGSIVNIGSIYGEVSPDQRNYEYRRSGGASFYKPAAYGVSKAALANLTRYLATYWAPAGVRVNTLIFAGVFNNQAEPFLRAYCAKVPLGRMAREDEYNGAVQFLLSDASSYMTGSEMVLDGGFTAW
jgi:NAD(P)-dependent dehydrogenase (short-subunit alcohol dehydrogenase family)